MQVLEKENQTISLWLKLKNNSLTHQYDFTSINFIEPYFFSEKLEVPTKKGFFIEFPILNYQVSFLERLLQKVKIRDITITFNDIE